MGVTPHLYNDIYMYKIDSCKRYKVTFLKDTERFKAGEESYVGMAIAIKFVNLGLVKAERELYNDAKAAGCDDLIKKAKSE